MRSTGLPVSCSLAMNFGCRTRIILAKGSSSILANRRILYQNYSVVDSGIHNRDFCTITNLVKPKLQVQFDICCRTGLIQRSLTEAKRMNSVHSPRLTLPREHFKLHPYTLCVPARLVCSNGRRRKYIAKPNSTASVDSQGDGV